MVSWNAVYTTGRAGNGETTKALIFVGFVRGAKRPSWLIRTEAEVKSLGPGLCRSATCVHETHRRIHVAMASRLTGSAMSALAGAVALVSVIPLIAQAPAARS